MKIAITGGHLTPALAVIEKLKELRPDCEIFFFGRRLALEGDKSESFESDIISQKNISFINITSGRLQRYFSFSNLLTPFKLLTGIIQSLLYIRKYGIDVVLSFGGYLSVPVVLAGWILRKKVVLHEQTVKLGLANRINSFFADIILISFENTKKYLPNDKIILTGNPLRAGILYENNSSAFLKLANTNYPVIFVTGGNQGSHVLNMLVYEIIPDLLKKYTVVHQCGSASEFKDFEKLADLKAKIGQESANRYFIYKSINPDEMGALYSVAHLVVGRSGINTVSEIFYYDIPSVLLPLPYSGGQEQRENALWLQTKLPVIILEQKNTKSAHLLAAIEKITANSTLKLNNNRELKTLFKSAAGNIAVNVIECYEASHK